MDTANIGKWLLLFGIVLAIVGGLFLLAGKWGFSGKLPGDVHIQKENFSFHFPILTSLVVSILLTIVLNLILWLFRK